MARQSIAQLALGDLPAALRTAAEAKRTLDAVGAAGSGEPLIRLAEVEALLAAGMQQEALALIAAVREVLLGRAARIGDAALRQSYFATPEIARLLALAREFLV